MYQERPRLSGNRLAAYNNLIKQDRRILVIGDLIDNHFSSYRSTDPNGYSGDTELEYAILI